MELSELKINKSNPRLIRDEKFKLLKKSVQEFPAMMELRPIVIDTDGTILGGNMRYRALLDLGYKELPDTWVKRADQLTDAEKQRFIIEDNVGFGEWEFDMLANEWDAESLKDWGMDLPTDWGGKLEATEDDYKIPDEIQTDIVVGDLFEIGVHRLLCGDSTDSDAVAKLMNGEKADMVFTDPPYGIGIDGQKESICKNPKHNRKKHEFKGWDSERPNSEIFGYLLSMNIPLIIFGGNYFTDLLPPSRGWIYWGKGQNGLTMSDGELAWSNIDQPLRAIEVNRANLGNTQHPTQKPVKVVDFCLKQIENANLILDVFLGSGTTMVAAHQLNRKCYGCELEPKYVEVSIQRMMKLDNTLKVKKNGVDITEIFINKIT